MKVIILLLIFLIPLSATTEEELDLLIEKDTVEVLVKDEEYSDNDAVLSGLLFVVITVLALYSAKKASE